MGGSAGVAGCSGTGVSPVITKLSLREFHHTGETPVPL